MWRKDNNTPCYKCAERTPGCHGKCERYLVYKRGADKVRDEANKRIAAIDAINGVRWRR